MAGQRPRGFKVTETDTPAQGSDSSQNRRTGRESGKRVVAAAEVQKRQREASGIPSDSERMATIQAQLEKRQRRESPAETSSRRQQFEEDLSLFGPRDQIDQQIAKGMARFDQQAARTRERETAIENTNRQIAHNFIDNVTKDEIDVMVRFARLSKNNDMLQVAQHIKIIRYLTDSTGYMQIARHLGYTTAQISEGAMERDITKDSIIENFSKLTAFTKSKRINRVSEAMKSILTKYGLSEYSSDVKSNNEG